MDIGFTPEFQANNPLPDTLFCRNAPAATVNLWLHLSVIDALIVRRLWIKAGDNPI
jgi:hypothetical protein